MRIGGAEANAFVDGRPAYTTSQHQRLQQLEPSFLGCNGILLTPIPYILATAIQYESIKSATIAGTASAGSIVVFGLFCQLMDLRTVRPPMCALSCTHPRNGRDENGAPRRFSVGRLHP